MEVVTPVVWGGRGVQGPGDKGNGSLASNRQVLPKEWRGKREEGDGGGGGRRRRGMGKEDGKGRAVEQRNGARRNGEEG